MTENMRDLVGFAGAWVLLAAGGIAYARARRSVPGAPGTRRAVGLGWLSATVIVAAFVAGSLAIAELFGGVGRVAGWLADRAQVSPLLLLLSPVVLIGVVGVVDRVRRNRSASLQQPPK